MNNRLYNFDYYQHVINKPGEVTLSREFSNILILNSEDRNRHLFPNSNQYEVRLNKTFSDVIEIELISIDYKYSRNLYDSLNSRIDISIDNNVYTFYIPTGRYSDALSICNAFNNVSQNSKNLQNRLMDIELSVLDNTNTMYFIIPQLNTAIDFSVLFRGDEITIGKLDNTNYHSNNRLNTGVYGYKNNTNGRIIGFTEKNFSNKIETNAWSVSGDIGDYILDLYLNNSLELDNVQRILSIVESKFIIKGTPDMVIEKSDIISYEVNNEQYRIRINHTVDISGITDLELYSNIVLGDTSYNLQRDHTIYLHIDGCDRINSTNVNIDSSFAAIPVDISNKIYFDNTKSYGTIKYFNPPKRSLDKLNIQFKDNLGKILDFTGKENSVILAIKSVNDKNTFNVN